MTTTNTTTNNFIDFSNVGYSTIKAHSSGSKVIRLQQKDSRENLRIITPVMLTWGASEIMEAGTDNVGTGKWSMSLQFPEEEYANAQTDEFYDAVNTLENKIKQDALDNSLKWFGKQHKMIEVIDALANPILKISKVKKPDGSDKKPTMSVKLPCYDGKWKPEIFDEDAVTVLFSSTNKNNIGTPIDYLPKMARVACEIECGGIWFSNGKYTVVWNLVQARVIRAKIRESGVCRMKLSAEEQSEVDAKPPLEKINFLENAEQEDAPDNSANDNTCAVVDTDDEGDTPVAETPEAVVPDAVDDNPIINVKPKPKMRAKK